MRSSVTVGARQKMASAKFLEEALSTDVDESAVNAIVGCLENQLGTSTPSATPQQGSPQEVTQNHMNSAISNGGSVSTQKHGVSPVDSMNNVLLNDGNKSNASSMATTQTTTIGQINTVLGSVPGTVINRSNYVNQVSTSLGLTQTSLANVSKGQEPVRILYPAASQAPTNQNINNRVTFPAPTVTTLQNGNLGMTSLSMVNPGTTVSQNPLPTSTNVTKPVGSIGVINSQDQTKSSSPALVSKTSGAPLTTQTVSVPSGVMSVPLSVSSSIALAGTTLNSAVTGSASTNVTGVVTVSRTLASTASTTSTNMLPGNLVLNVNPVRPATPGAAGHRTVGPRVLIGTPHITGNRQATSSISLSTLQALQSGVQGTFFLRTDNGIQLVRLGTPTAVTPTTMTQSTTTSVAGGTTASQPAFRLQTVPAVSSNNGTNTVRVPVYLGTVPVATTTATSVQTTSVSNVPALTTQPVVAVQPQVRQTPLDTTKEKCRKFLANLLDLSTREPRTVERSVRSLIQELVDGIVEPDVFCTRLEKLLNASPQPCLIGFLKKSLPLLRQSMISNELVIEGIRPPPSPARPQQTTVLLTPTTNTTTVTGVPQIQNQVRAAGVSTQTVRLVAPFSSATTPVAATGTVVGGIQGTRPTLQMHHRLVSVPLTTSGAPGLVSTVSTATTPVVSTSSPSPAQSPTSTTGVVNAPPLHRPAGPQTLSMQTRTLMPIKQPVGVPVGVRPQMVQIRTQAPLIRTTAPVRVTTPVNKTTAIQSKVNTHTKVTTIQKPVGKTEQFVPTLATVRVPVPSLAVASNAVTSGTSTLVSAGTPSVLPSLASTPALTASSTPSSTVLVVSSASQTVATSSVISSPSLATTTSQAAFSVPTTPQVIKAVAKEKKSFSSAGYTGDDDINDVAAMGGVNLAEETQRILGSTEFVGTTIRSCKDDIFLHAIPLQQRIKKIVAEHGLDEPLGDVAALISHATQEKLKNLVEKLDVIAEHRLDQIKMDQRYEVAQDVKGQLKFLEELDKMERKRHDEQERELLLRAAKSRSKTEDPEQAKLKAKAREMQRAEMEEVRQREANLTALQAIGVRKKPRLEGPNPNGESLSQVGGIGLGNNSGSNRMALPPRPRLKRVNLRDLVFLLEQEKDTRRSSFLYKAYLK